MRADPAGGTATPALRSHTTAPLDDPKRHGTVGLPLALLNSVGGHQTHSRAEK